MNACKTQIPAVLVVLAFLLSPTCGDAQSVIATVKSPKDIVKEYVTLDAAGAWMTAEGRSRLQRLTTDKIFVPTIIAPTIISVFRLTSTRIEPQEASVTVAYELVGYSENLSSFERRRGVETQTVRLKRIDGNWTITSQSFPHMYAQTVINLLRRAKRRALVHLNSLSDPSQRKKYAAQIKYENRQRDRLIRKILKASEESMGQKSGPGSASP